VPTEQPLWQWVTHEFERLCTLYGYRRIQTPAFEQTDLFVRTSGESSDIVQKEMYTFKDRGNRSLTLRPEATAPIVRAYLEHGLYHQVQPQKLFSIETLYRYGRPQKGRFREFWQLDVEAIGSNDPAIDAEVIQLYRALLERLGVSAFSLALNSIGDRNCRPAYLAHLRQWLSERESHLDQQTREQSRRNPLRALDNIAAKPPHVQQVLRQAPAIGEALCKSCRDHFADVCRYLDAYGVRYELVPTLVRGLDYYTRTTWEFVGPEAGAQSTLSGGGRYDGLAEELGGDPTPGVGFGAGVERLLSAVQTAQAIRPPQKLPTEPELDVFIACEDVNVRRELLPILASLRERGVSADIDYAGRSLNKQMTYAVRQGARRVVVFHGSSVVANVREAGRPDWTLSLLPKAEFVDALSR